MYVNCVLYVYVYLHFMYVNICVCGPNVKCGLDSQTGLGKITQENTLYTYFGIVLLIGLYNNLP